MAHTVGSEVVLLAEKRAGVDRSVQIVPVEVSGQLIDLNPQLDALGRLALSRVFGVEVEIAIVLLILLVK